MLSFFSAFSFCTAPPPSPTLTTSLNVYIISAVQGTQYYNISSHQWLTLPACVVTWLSCLTVRRTSKLGLLTDNIVVCVFLFLLGHTHNLVKTTNSKKKP